MKGDPDNNVTPHDFVPIDNETGEVVEIPKSTLKDVEENAQECNRDLCSYLESDRVEDTILLDCIRKTQYIVGALKFYLER